MNGGKNERYRKAIWKYIDSQTKSVGQRITTSRQAGRQVGSGKRGRPERSVTGFGGAISSWLVERRVFRATLRLLSL